MDVYHRVFAVHQVLNPKYKNNEGYATLSQQQYWREMQLFFSEITFTSFNPLSPESVFSDTHKSKDS